MHCRVTVAGYVCVCARVCLARFIQTVMNRPRRPMDHLSAAFAWFITWGFHKTAFSQRYRIRVAALELRSAILLALADAQMYIHSRDIALDHMWCFCYGLCHCFWCVSSSLDVDFDYVQSFAWRKVWSYIPYVAKCSRSIIFANFANGAHSRILLFANFMFAHTRYI